MTTESPTEPRPFGLALVGSMIALTATLWAIVLCTATFAAGDHGAVLTQALACAAGSTVLIAVCWRWTPRQGRIIALMVLAANGWVCFDAARRLLAG